jgi:antitoxin component YwqK of YwqJK toxin-antitoxin module
MSDTGDPEAPTADVTQVERRDAEGHVIERAEFLDGVLHGTSAVFAPNGLVLQEMGFFQGQPDGPMLVHDENGQLSATLTWLAGALDGPATIFNDGRVLAEMAIVLGYWTERCASIPRRVRWLRPRPIAMAG